MLVEKFAHLALGQRAHEAIDRLAVHQQHAGGDAADAEHARQLLLLVGVDLGQLEAARVVGFELFQHGPSDLQGPHQGAQKSTSTGTFIEAATTSASKFSTVTSIMMVWAMGL
jgi:hypothetical protein